MTVTEKNLDRSRWYGGPGPWDNEPDYRHWVDEATGLDCLIVRNNCGALCGYVGVMPDHAWYQQGSDEIDRRHDYGLAHGGLTFAGHCHGHICHPADHGTDPVWWLGFDTAHAGDEMPMRLLLAKHINADLWRSKVPGDVYRDLPYVIAEVEQLAQKAATNAV